MGCRSPGTKTSSKIFIHIISQPQTHTVILTTKHNYHHYHYSFPCLLTLCSLTSCPCLRCSPPLVPVPACVCARVCVRACQPSPYKRLNETAAYRFWRRSRSAQISLVRSP